VPRTMRVRRLGPGTELEILRAGYLFEQDPELSAARSYLADSHNVFLMAYEGSEAVGMLRGTEVSQLYSKRKQMLVHEIAVDERLRRRGIGKGLITYLLRECRELGFAEVLLYVDPTNAATVRLCLTTGALPESEANRLFVYRLHSDIEGPI